ncbi:MAG: 6-hydroxycyclohex-1-ene-1-carbonyl-CoA dehydrogenase [bacterium]
MRIASWVFREAGAAMVLEERECAPEPGEVLIQVCGCGVCHTDLGFYYEGVPTRHPLPLTLGHEVAGRVVEAGTGAAGWLGADVVVPAVIPCGTCDACRAHRGSVCPSQIFPGNDVHGGFGTHLVVPARGLCRVPDLSDRNRNPRGLELCDLSVIADAISTPYQAIRRAEVGPGDLAIFVGVGGVGGFGAQIAAALGAHVAVIDVDPRRLALVAEHGADLTLDASELDFKSIRMKIRALADGAQIPSFRTKIFETSGTVAGQATAFGLLTHGAHLSIVGFTPAKVELRLSNVMAFDATVQGNWGCLPELYPEALELVLAGKVVLGPFVERRPLSSINRTFADLREHRISRRVVLTPES